MSTPQCNTFLTKSGSGRTALYRPVCGIHGDLSEGFFKQETAEGIADTHRKNLVPPVQKMSEVTEVEFVVHADAAADVTFNGLSLWEGDSLSMEVCDHHLEATKHVVERLTEENGLENIWIEKVTTTVTRERVESE